jgi:hypothetical protein
MLQGQPVIASLDSLKMSSEHYVLSRVYVTMDGVDYLHTPLGTTANYSATANLHNSQITTAPAKPFSSLLWLHQPFPNNGF